MASLFGWELLFKSVEADIRNDQDVLVCFAHLVLISNGFKCVGLGESKNLDGTETKSELLPRGWTENYAVRYVYEGQLYNLQASNVGFVILNLLRVQERNVSMMHLDSREVVGRTGNLDQMIPKHVELAANIKAQLIDKVAVSTKYKDSTSQTSRGCVHTVRPAPHPDPAYPDLLENPFQPPSYDPIRNVGRSDLNPFGVFGPPLQPPGAGGSLFVPPRRPGNAPGPNAGVAPGSVPPGARFDPFREPPDVDRGRWQRRPDYDEFPPPGFDDMFM